MGVCGALVATCDLKTSGKMEAKVGYLACIIELKLYMLPGLASDGFLSVFFRGSITDEVIGEFANGKQPFNCGIGTTLKSEARIEQMTGFGRRGGIFHCLLVFIVSFRGRSTMR